MFSPGTSSRAGSRTMIISSVMYSQSRKFSLLVRKVNWQTWLANGWLRPHQNDAAEIRDLWLIAGRDLKDAASGGISSDWQFGIAFNAALKLCTILLYAEGYRPEKQLTHYRTLQALPVILGLQHQDD